jgi:hypothetical protein
VKVYYARLAEHVKLLDIDEGTTLRQVMARQGISGEDVERVDVRVDSGRVPIDSPLNKCCIVTIIPRTK